MPFVVVIIEQQTAFILLTVYICCWLAWYLLKWFVVVDEEELVDDEIEAEEFFLLLLNEVEQRRVGLIVMLRLQALYFCSEALTLSNKGHRLLSQQHRLESDLSFVWLSDCYCAGWWSQIRSLDSDLNSHLSSFYYWRNFCNWLLLIMIMMIVMRHHLMIMMIVVLMHIHSIQIKKSPFLVVSLLH